VTDPAAILTIAVERAFGPVVEGEVLLSEEGFSPRYDLDRWSGVITKPGHRLEGISVVGRICVFPTAKGGIAAGWMAMQRRKLNRWVTAAALAALVTMLLLGGVNWLRIWQAG